jgi:hypothetical protein
MENSHQPEAHERRVGGSSPEMIFVWVALVVAIGVASALAAATDTGILSSAPPPMSGASPDNGSGVGYLLMDIFGALALGGVLLYGLVRYHTRNRANDRISEAATRAEYQDPQSYDQQRARFNEQLKPTA